MEENNVLQTMQGKLEEIDKITAAAYKTASSIYAIGQENEKASAFAQDTFMYYDMNDMQGLIETLRLFIDNLKRALIELKTYNDRLLLHGGFVKCIDSRITSLFLSTSLCHLQATDRKTIEVLQDVAAQLGSLKEELAKEPA